MTNPASRLDTPRGVPVSLPSFAIVDASGADVGSFLQGQLSNDLAGAGAGRACLAGYCNPKGRLLALPLVLPLTGGTLRLIVPGELVPGLLQRLRMFVLRADVVLAVRDDLSCFGLTIDETVGAPAGTGTTLTHGIAALPTEPLAAPLDVVGGAEGDDVAQLCRWHDVPAEAAQDDASSNAAAPDAVTGATGSAQRYLIVAAPDAVTGDIADGDAAWRAGDIAAGVPRIVTATREAFVPQMVNLQLVGGLSFRKGCYPGQEIVARMQYLGKLKRHMRRFRVADDGAAGHAGDESGLAPGVLLTAGDDTDAGVVVDAVRTATGIELLAVVRVAADIERLAVDGRPLEPRPLPYALADAAGDVPEASA